MVMQVSCFTLDTKPKNNSVLYLCLFYRSLDTFWPTTGMFPQEFIISFTALMSIGNIKILSSNGKRQTLFAGKITVSVAGKLTNI